MFVCRSDAAGVPMPAVIGAHAARVPATTIARILRIALSSTDKKNGYPPNHCESVIREENPVICPQCAGRNGGEGPAARRNPRSLEPASRFLLFSRRLRLDLETAGGICRPV